MNTKIIAVAVVSVFGLGYFTADHFAELEFLEYQRKANEQLFELEQEIQVINREHRARIRSLEFEFQTQLNRQQDTYEKTITDLRTNFKPSGVSKCPSTDASLSRPDRDTSNLVCYTEAELRRKIGESLAIGNEADELALKYETLLRMVKQ